ncbi:YflJ family protein [Bacillus manliponensis]
MRKKNPFFLYRYIYWLKRYKGEWGHMHYGSKGWYVHELKKLGIRHYEGRKLESYRGHVLRNLWLAVKEEKQ